MKIDKVIKILRLGRFVFPFTGVLLFSFGALLALVSGAEFHLYRFMLGLGVTFLGQLSVSYSNDFFDVEVDGYNESCLLYTSPSPRD